MQINFKDLQDTLPQRGKIQQIFIRPEKYASPLSVQQVTASSKTGLQDDHYRSSGSNKRQVTLIQYEHIAAMASLLGIDAIDASLLRRNLVVSGINLLALKDKVFNAMRGHGGITARVVRDGTIRINDLVRMVR
ncbi:MAG: hypothetical protein AMJ55_05995 [Gammaproteobacteria bacterium SG8_15]|nr:MAG: hypothetical protein AMJ55_05995 [Gammaproteobacteria bacterium SG8_15]